jgi:hypothetical protein
LSLRNWGNLEPIHTKFRVIARLLGEARVDNEVDSVDGQTGLSDVCSNDDLASSGRSWFEDLGCSLCRECAIDWEDDQLRYLWTKCLHSLCYDLARIVNLFFTGQKDEDIAVWLRKMDLHGGHKGGIEIIIFWLS